MRMILNALHRVDAVLGFHHVVRHVVPLCVVLAVFAPAADAHKLTKRRARAEASAFVSPVFDLQTRARTVRAVITPARDCRRLSPMKVACRFAVIYPGGTIHARLVARLLPEDDLVGIWLSIDPADYWGF